MKWILIEMVLPWDPTSTPVSSATFRKICEMKHQGLCYSTASSGHFTTNRPVTFTFIKYFQQGCMTLIKRNRKSLLNYDVTLLLYLFLNFYNSENKMHHSFHIFSSTTDFNTDNNQQCFFSSKAEYYYDFWRSCDTDDWRNDAENTALIIE